MQIGYNLELKQTQKLVMTQELRQAIELLQFNTLELNDYLKEEMENNPLLEIESNNKNKEQDQESIEEHKEAEEEIDWEKYAEQYGDISYRPQIDKNKEEHNFESFVSYSPSLKEHLLDQLKFVDLNRKEYLIGKYLIENINENGYINTSVDDISKQLNINIDKIEEILEIIQGFDPLGVGARDLRESLLIQIKDEKSIDPIIQIIIENYLNDIASNKMNKISKELDIDIKTIQEACDYIKELEPKPGRNFSGDLDSVRYIEADANIEWIDGEFVITVNDSTGPRLNINNYYKSLLSKSADKNATEFLSERLNKAMWIIKSIEQRRQTIYNVVESILKFQYEFFKTGNKELLIPLTLNQVAEDIEMHQSTISRTTNEKHVQTPYGLYELKYFFSTGLVGEEKDVSSTSIKTLIKELINNEDPKKPYSDQKISDLLKEDGTKISRRTVAKYRTEMEIPASTLRRRY